MSELKAYKMVNEMYCTDVRVIPAEVYFKSEADKVISELKEKHKTEVKELLCLIRDKDNNFNRAFDSEEKELRHNKYKRCLAMAQEWRNYAAFCGMQSSCHNHRGFGKTAEKWTWKEIHAWRCVNRLMKISKKFNEEK